MEKKNLGRTATDKITGFAGTVTGRCEYITGCPAFLVQPHVKPDGDDVESKWFDEDRLKFGDLSSGGAEVLSEVDKRVGGDKPAPRK